MDEMTPAQRAEAIRAHLAAHERKLAQRVKARQAKASRNKQRGLDDLVARLRDQLVQR